jgi:hypothetical protein
MSIRVQDRIGNSRSHPGVDDLLEAHLIEASADVIVPDHGDRLPLIAREGDESNGFVSFVDVHMFLIEVGHNGASDLK